MIVEALVAIFVGGAALNVWASWHVFRDEVASWPQRWGQFAFVWLVPVVGALVTLHLKRAEPERGAGTYREVPDAGDDFGYSGKAERHAFRSTDESSNHHDVPGDDP